MKRSDSEYTRGISAVNKQPPQTSSAFNERAEVQASSAYSERLPSNQDVSSSSNGLLPSTQPSSAFSNHSPRRKAVNSASKGRSIAQSVSSLREESRSFNELASSLDERTVCKNADGAIPDKKRFTAKFAGVVSDKKPFVKQAEGAIPRKQRLIRSETAFGEPLPAEGSYSEGSVKERSAGGNSVKKGSFGEKSFNEGSSDGRSSAGFLRSAALLTVCGVLAKIIGAVYRIPLTNMLGAYGIGLYQLTFPLYALLVTLSAAGIPTAVSKIVAEKTEKGDEQGAKRCFMSALFILTGAGFLFGGLLFVLGGRLASLQKTPELASAYRVIAGAIPAECITAAFKGWFYGKMNMKPSAVSQIVEQVVKMAVGLIAVNLCLPDVLSAVYAAVGAVTASETAGLIVTSGIYLLGGKGKRSSRLGGKNSHSGRTSVRATSTHASSTSAGSNRTRETATYANPIGKTSPNATTNATAVKAKKPFTNADSTAKESVKELISCALPLTLAAIVLPVAHLIDSLMVQNLINLDNRTELYGLWSGPVHSLITMPSVFIMGIAASVVPGMAGSCAVGDKRAISEKLNLSMALSLGISLPISFGLAFLPREICSLLYPRFSGSDVDVFARLLTLGSGSIVFMSVLMTTNSVLQANGKMYVPVIALTLGSAVKCLMDFFLYKNPSVNIYEEGISHVACNLVACLVNLVYIRKKLGLVINIRDACLKPFASATAMTLFIAVTKAFFPELYNGKNTLFAIASAGILYASLLALFWKESLLSPTFFVRRK